MTLRRTLAALALLTAAPLALAACTAAAPPSHDGVATLSTAATTPTPTASAVDSQRPQERLDMTQEELSTLVQRWFDCRTAITHDAKMLTGPLADRAIKACASLEPLPPWEIDSSNPEAHDFMVAVVACLKSKGVRYVEVYDPASAPSADGSTSEIVGLSLGGPDNDSQSISQGMALTPTCEQAVAAAKNK